MAKKILSILVVACTFCCVAACSTKSTTPARNSALFNQYKSIAHALGSIGGYAYTNSLEAFEFNYAKGFRIFEIDLLLSAENEVIAIHDGSNDILGEQILQNYGTHGRIPLAEFKAAKIHDTYTTLDITDVNNLMTQYPNIYFVTDTKYTDSVNTNIQFNRIKAAISPQNIDRILPQVYHFEMYDQIKTIHDWKNIILTLYQNNYNDDTVIAGTTARGDIMAATMWSWRQSSAFNARLAALGVPVYVHTINTVPEWESLRAQGVHGIYTDELLVE